MRSRKGYKSAAFEKVKDGESKQWRDNTNVPSPVEAVAQLNAPVPVVLVGSTERLQDSKLNAAGITVLKELVSTCLTKMGLAKAKNDLWYCPNNLDGDLLTTSDINGANNLAKGTLS